MQMKLQVNCILRNRYWLSFYHFTGRPNLENINHRDYKSKQTNIFSAIPPASSASRGHRTHSFLEKKLRGKELLFPNTMNADFAPSNCV